jgi:hypothetical protein
MTMRFAAMAAVIAAGAGVASADVWLLGANDQAWLGEVKNTIAGTGLIAGNIDTFDLRFGTPTLQQLQAYDCVMVMSDFSPQDGNLLGNNLADYVDGGGGVVVTTFAQSFGIDGRFDSQNYDPMDGSGPLQGTVETLGTVFDALHPILAGVGSFNGGSSSYRNGNGPVNGTVVADWSDGTHLVVANTSFAGRVAGLNFYPPSSLSRSDFWDINTDGDILMANALNWTCPPGCYPDLDGNGTLDLFDFLLFITEFDEQTDRTDCEDDGQYDLFDFLCFVNAFDAGC